MMFIKDDGGGDSLYIPVFYNKIHDMYVFIYLKARVTLRERERQRALTLQLVKATSSGSGWIQKHGTPLCSPAGRDPSTWGVFCCHSGTLKEPELEVEDPGHKPTLIWDADPKVVGYSAVPPHQPWSQGSASDILLFSSVQCLNASTGYYFVNQW